MPEIAPSAAPAAPVKPSGPPPALTPQEALAEVRKSAAPAAGAPGTAPAGSGTPSAAPSGGTPAASDPAKPAGGDDVALAKLAKEQRRIDSQRSQLENDRKALHGAAEDGARWRTLRETAGKSKVEAIKAVFGEDAVEDVYWELNDHVLKTHKEPTAEEKAARAARAETSRVLEEKAAAEKKAREDKESATTAEVQRVQSEFVSSVSKYHAANYDKYPALKALLERFPTAVSERDILTFARTHHEANGKLPGDEEILQHFEVKAKAEGATTQAPSTAATPTVTREWRGDSPVHQDKELTLAEITEQAKREAFGNDYRPPRR